MKIKNKKSRINKISNHLVKGKRSSYKRKHQLRLWYITIAINDIEGCLISI